MGPMGLQWAKLQRDDLEHCWQSLQETRRGHSKTGNVPILGKKNFKFSIEYSIGFLLIVFYRIFANSFL